MSLDFFDEQADAWQEAIVPLDAAERATGQLLFERALAEETEIRPGTRFGHVIKAFSPWADKVGAMLGIDFEAYLAEARAPILAERRLNLSGIAVSAYFEFDADSNMSDVQEMRDLEKAERDPTWTPRLREFRGLRAHYFWHMEALKAGSKTLSVCELGGINQNIDAGPAQETVISISDAAINAFAHVPVRLEPRVTVADNTMTHPRTSDVAGPILNPDSRLVTDRPWGRHEGRYAETEARIIPTLGESVVNGLFGGIFVWPSPTVRDGAIAKREGRGAIDRDASMQLNHEDGDRMLSRNFLGPLRRGAAHQSDETQRLIQVIEEATGVRALILPSPL